MASVLDISDSSDSENDIDYVPNEVAGDSSCDEDVSDDEDPNAQKTKPTKREEAKIKSDSSSKIDEKQRANDLWKSFLNDVESETPNNPNPGVCHPSISTEIRNTSEVKTPELKSKPICKVFEFAGEPLTVFEKDLNSCDSVLLQTAPEKNNSETNETEKTPPLVPKKRGIDSVLGAVLNKNKKLTVLDKTLLDWKMFKKDEGLDNELEKFNKGKQGFIERQRFLERSDLRTFEMEKSMRQRCKKK